MARAITVAVLLLSGCSGCVRPALLPSQFTPAILIAPTMPHAYAVTSCSANNVPVIRVDSLTWESPDVEIIIRHEEVHAQRAYAYRGGCWPFVYRYRADKAFRVREQLAAYCVASRFAMTRNRNPELLWQYIVNVMRPDTTLTAKDNCLFEPWGVKQ